MTFKDWLIQTSAKLVLINIHKSVKDVGEPAELKLHQNYHVTLKSQLQATINTAAD